MRMPAPSPLSSSLPVAPRWARCSRAETAWRTRVWDAPSVQVGDQGHAAGVVLEAGVVEAGRGAAAGRGGRRRGTASAPRRRGAGVGRVLRRVVIGSLQRGSGSTRPGRRWPMRGPKIVHARAIGGHPARPGPTGPAGPRAPAAAVAWAHDPRCARRGGGGRRCDRAGRRPGRPAAAGLAVTLVDPAGPRGQLGRRRDAGPGGRGPLRRGRPDRAQRGGRPGLARRSPPTWRRLGPPGALRADGTLLVAVDPSDRAAIDDLLAYRLALGLGARRLTARRAGRPSRCWPRASAAAPTWPTTIRSTTGGGGRPGRRLPGRRGAIVDDEVTASTPAPAGSPA